MAGGKVAGTHTTVIDAAKRVVKIAEKDPDVSKIVLGFITSGLPVGKHLLKFTTIHGGCKVTVRGTHSKQEIFVYSDDVLATTLRLQSEF